MENLEYKNLVIKIEHDDSPESPRDWDNLGTMVCFHRRYSLGDKHKYSYPEEIEKHIKESGAIALPLYLMDHSGLSMSTGSFGCPWDSGQVGVIYVNREKVLKEYSCKIITKKIREKVIKCLVSEVSTYSQYLEGDIFGYTVETSCGEHLDSCWGFYGYEDCLHEAKNSADHYSDSETKAKLFAENYGMATL